MWFSERRGSSGTFTLTTCARSRIAWNRELPPAKHTHIKPETAYLVVKALRAWNATPKREAIVREVCRLSGGCEPQCVGCIGRANAITGLYEARAAW
jgi:hypothetical protein